MTTSSTTWIGGASSDFQTASKWRPTFVQTGGIDYYGDATINAGGTLAALDQGTGGPAGILLLDGGTLRGGRFDDLSGTILAGHHQPLRDISGATNSGHRLWLTIRDD